MPNVNLIEDEGAEGLMESAPTPKPRSGARGGGIGRVVSILLVFVVIVGGVFLLNRYGIIRLWSKKPAPIVTQVDQPPFADLPAPTETDQPSAPEKGIELVETPPIEERKKPSETVEPGSASKQLAEMKGNYTIQVFAYRDKAMAEVQVKKLEAAGYPGFVEAREFKSEPWYTVRIGRYQSAKEAAEAVKGFAYELRSRYWIDKIRSQ